MGRRPKPAILQHHPATNSALVVDSLNLKAPLLPAVLSLATALLGCFWIRRAIIAGNSDLVILNAIFVPVALLAARVTIAPRIEIASNSLAFRSNPITWKRRALAWNEIEDVQLHNSGAFAWPQLHLRLRNNAKPLVIPMPMVHVARRQEALMLIRQHLATANAAASAQTPPTSSTTA
jgi:hypothetical protein